MKRYEVEVIKLLQDAVNMLLEALYERDREIEELKRVTRAQCHPILPTSDSLVCADDAGPGVCAEQGDANG